MQPEEDFDLIDLFLNWLFAIQITADCSLSRTQRRELQAKDININTAGFYRKKDFALLRNKILKIDKEKPSLRPCFQLVLVVSHD